MYFGDLFYATFDEVRDVELMDALGSLLSILEEGLNNGDVTMGARTRKDLLQWYISQPAFIRSICEPSMRDARLFPETDHNSDKMSTPA